MREVTAEQVDPLQLELETLLVAVVQRKQQIRAQLEALDHDDSIPSPPPALRTERKLSPECSPLLITACKKARGLSGSRTDSPPLPLKTAKKATKGKCKKVGSLGDEEEGQKSHSFQNGQKSGRYPMSISSVPTAIPNDSNHRFWTHLDEYCRPPSEESLRTLESIVVQQEMLRTSEFVKVPSLGQHYTVKWAKDDLFEEQREAAPEIPSSELKEDMERILRCTAKESLNDQRYGSLAQRLMTCLMDQTSDSNVKAIRRTMRVPGNITEIEERIRKELEDLGVMQALAEKVAERDDEIFLELRKCQSQLLSLARQNVTMTQNAIQSAQLRITEANWEAQRRAIDSEILEHFKKRKTTTQKKNAIPILNPPNRKEREQLESLLERREAIVSQLEQTRDDFQHPLSPSSASSSSP